MSLKEYYTFNRVGTQDAMVGHGYGTTKPKAKERPVSADGFPYDLWEPEEDGDMPIEDDPGIINKFSSKMGDYIPSKDGYVSRKGDPFTYFDDASVGLAEEESLREYVQELLEFASMIRMRPRSGESDGVVNQFGLRIPGGTQFGWSSAYQFPQKKDQYEPVYSLRDLMTKHEDQWDRTSPRTPNDARSRGKLEPEPEKDWKEEHGEEEWEKGFPLFWENEKG